MAGCISVLNTKHGDEELQIPDDSAKAKEMVDGLLRKGYSITLQVDGGTKRVSSYDATTNEFIVNEVVTVEKEVTEVKKLTETKELRFSAATAKATAIPPTAGG